MCPSTMTPLARTGYKMQMEIYDNPLEQVPDWVLSPIPADAVEDQELQAQVRAAIEASDGDLQPLIRLLDLWRDSSSFPYARNLANALIWLVRESLYHAPRPAFRLSFVAFADKFFPRDAQLRVLRRLAKDPSQTVFRSVAKCIRKNGVREVSLGDGSRLVDDAGWRNWKQDRELSRHDQGTVIQESRGVTVIPNVESLRQVLGIFSSKQLGWLLTSTDRGGGPYVRFTIAKRDGSDRLICAPKGRLRAVQRRILATILDHVPTHDAAHGFVTGRSTVTNAQPHVGAKVLLKFDLRNFFPTIHWSRVLGLFTSLGYYSGSCRIEYDDRSRNVAMTLARLCTYTPDPRQWYCCTTPQGAPTSPAIANLICRGLDARLTGLASTCDGVYTRYADDLTFSFRDAAVDVGRIRWWVDQICHQEGFFVNQSKLRVIRATSRQVVTGIVVNDTMRIPREQRRRFRAMIHNCRQHGIDSQRRDHPNFEAYLTGFANYIKMVHREEGEQLLEEVRELLDGERM